jgi:hypothetical protein
LILGSKRIVDVDDNGGRASGNDLAVWLFGAEVALRWLMDKATRRPEGSMCVPEIHPPPWKKTTSGRFPGFSLGV